MPETTGRREAGDVARVVPPGSSGHVLLAEDDPVNQRVATAMLGTLGFQVDVVADGAEAVKAATLRPYRAVLMDCQIPVLDGYQATGEIRRIEGRSRRTPIIAVTASTTPPDRQRCLAADMDDYVAKPLTRAALATVLARWAPAGPGPAAPDDPTTAAPAPDVLDAVVVARLVRLGAMAGEDLPAQLKALFLAASATHVVELRAALAEDDGGAVHRAAHTLGGASANLGATGLTRLCESLAREGAAGDLRDGGATLEAVEAELVRVRSALGSTLIP